MTNTIPNVPRELLERVAKPVLFKSQEDAHADSCAELRALLSAPSPAGVDGLEVRAYEHVLHMELGQKECFFSEIEELPFGVKGEDFSATYDVTSDPLCRLSDAQAIIDGLREDRDSHQRACIRAMEDRNQPAKCLKFARTTMSVVADNANLRGVEHRSLIAEVNRIDSALSAGKDSAS